MSKRENLQYVFKNNQAVMKLLLDDITEEESLFRGDVDLQHIRWHAGHLVYASWLILQQLGITVDMPDGWLKLFQYGCEFSEDSTVYPALSDLRSQLNEYHEKINTRVSEISDDDLDTKLAAETMFDTTAMNATLRLCTHDFYHAGQIANIRRLLGRERSFG